MKRIRIERVAVGQFPDAVVGGCFRQQFLEIRDQLLISRINLVCDFGFHTLLEIGALLFGQLVDLGRARLERRGQNIFGRRLGDEVAHFLEHFFDDESRRQNLFLLAELQAFERLIELFRQPIQSHDVILAVLLAEEPVGVGHERGILVLDAKELINRIVVPLPLLAFDLVLEKPIEHVGGKFLRGRLSV